jgi:hypothetical protein
VDAGNIGVVEGHGEVGCVMGSHLTTENNVNSHITARKSWCQDRCKMVIGDAAPE